MPEKGLESIATEAVRRMNEHTRRLRALEEKNDLLGVRINLVEDRLLKTIEEIRTKTGIIEKRLKDIDNNFMRIDNEITKINKMLEKSAKKVELQELQNMLSLFHPLKSRFVTKEEVKKMIDESREEKL